MTACPTHDSDIACGKCLFAWIVGGGLPRPVYESHDYWPFAVSSDDPPPYQPDPPDPPKCPDCNGRGKIPLFTGEVDCDTCGGSGY